MILSKTGSKFQLIAKNSHTCRGISFTNSFGYRGSSKSFIDPASDISLRMPQILAGIERIRQSM